MKYIAVLWCYRREDSGKGYVSTGNEYFVPIPAGLPLANILRLGCEMMVKEDNSARVVGDTIVTTDEIGTFTFRLLGVYEDNQPNLFHQVDADLRDKI